MLGECVWFTAPAHSKRYTPSRSVWEEHKVCLWSAVGKMWLWGEGAVLIIVCSHHAHISKQALLHLLCPFFFFLGEKSKTDPDSSSSTHFHTCSVVRMSFCPKYTRFVEFDCQISLALSRWALIFPQTTVACVEQLRGVGILSVSLGLTSSCCCFWEAGVFELALLVHVDSCCVSENVLLRVNLTAVP